MFTATDQVDGFLKDMDRCRICLKYRKKKLKSIFEKETDSTFADMIILVSHVKILNKDGVTDKICHICRRKLKDSYEFIILIERSHSILQQTAGIKRICFNNISDVKLEIELIQNDNKDYLIHLKNLNGLYKNEKSMISYNDTVIKRIDGKDSDSYQDGSNPADMLNFLDIIRNESYCDNDYLNDNEWNTNDDYEQSFKQRRNKKYARAKINASKNSENSTGYHCRPIKPIFFKDIRVMAANRRLSKTRYKYKCRNKKDMCPYCGKMSSQLTTHMLIHTGERNFKCDRCNKGFFTKKILEIHLKRHSAIKNFKCNECVASFSSKDSLKSHMLSHTDERNYSCDICKKAFKRKSSLSRHVMIHSFSCKTIKCELCTMSFLTKYSLKHHMRVHTGERPYRCEICSQPYSYKHDFNRHCFKKHGIFLKRRSVYIMNEEVLKQERILMRELMLRTHGMIEDDKGLNPFEGPQAAQAFAQAVKALQDKQIHIVDQQL